MKSGRAATTFGGRSTAWTAPGVIARMSSYGKDTLNSLQQSLEEEAVMRTQTLESLEAQGVSEFPVPKPFAMYPANRREF